MRFEKTVTIQRPLDEVFAFLSDAENDVKWRTNVKKVKRVSGGDRSGVGVVYEQVVKGPLGSGFPADLKYTQFEHNRRFAFDTIKGAVRPSAVVEFSEAAENATEVHFTMVWEPEGGIKVVAPIFGSMLRKGIDDSYENLKKVLAPR